MNLSLGNLYPLPQLWTKTMATPINASAGTFSRRKDVKNPVKKERYVGLEGEPASSSLHLLLMYLPKVQSTSEDQ